MLTYVVDILNDITQFFSPPFHTIVHRKMRLSLAFSLMTLASAWVNPSIHMGRIPLARRGAPLQVLAEAPNEVEIKPDAENSSVELTINVTGEQTKDAYARVVADASKNMDIPGFRKVRINGQEVECENSNC